MKNLKFVPTHQTKEGIVTGELRTDDLFGNFICNIEETNAKEIIRAVNMNDELIKKLYELERAVTNYFVDNNKTSLDKSRIEVWRYEAKQLLKQAEQK